MLIGITKINRVLALMIFYYHPKFDKRPPMGLDNLLENQLGNLPVYTVPHYSLSTPAWNLATGQSSGSCTYNLFLHQRDEIQLILALHTAVFEKLADFQNCHIWAWNLTISQSSRSCTYTLFLSQCVEIELIFALWAAVSKIWPGF